MGSAPLDWQFDLNGQQQLLCSIDVPNFSAPLPCLHDLGVTCLAFVVAYLLRSLLVHFEFFSERFPRHLSLQPLSAAHARVPVIWAVVGYFSSFYRDLELSNPIQLIVNIVSQLAIVLVVIYAGLYLLRRDDISRSYVLLIGVHRFCAAAVRTRSLVSAASPGCATASAATTTC